jgi:hypothetical protein
MRVLLVHLEDDFSGPWSAAKWDMVVDLARAPASFYAKWSQAFDCPVISLYDFAHEIEDLHSMRRLLELGRRQLVDRVGVDWWDILSLMLQPELQAMTLVQRLAERLKNCRELVATRSSRIALALQTRVGCKLHVLQDGLWRRGVSRLANYDRVRATLTSRQVLQVVFDKYDPTYALRRRLAPPPRGSAAPVVLLPSAYINVSGTAVAYASLLPAQPFLLVWARDSGRLQHLPENVSLASLASYAVPQSPNREELASLADGWGQLEQKLGERPEFGLAVAMGVLDRGRKLLPWGLALRDAWNQALERENVVGCLSADDSNPATRIPLVLARQRGIPAVACHHGALDGGMAFKQHHGNFYLAKGEMERDYLLQVCGVPAEKILVGSPQPGSETEAAPAIHNADAPWIVFFSEPYESDNGRAQEIHREVLPRLCAVARRCGRKVLLKLHPFESMKQRKRMLDQVLSSEDRPLVEVIADPITPDLLRKVWVAVTVESTTAFECACAGIPVFLLGWLRHAYSGYAPQFAKFGIGKLLGSPKEIGRILEYLDQYRSDPGLARRLVTPIAREELTKLLGGEQRSLDSVAAPSVGS